VHILYLSSNPFRAKNKELKICSAGKQQVRNEALSFLLEGNKEESKESNTGYKQIGSRHENLTIWPKRCHGLIGHSLMKWWLPGVLQWDRKRRFWFIKPESTRLSDRNSTGEGDNQHHRPRGSQIGGRCWAQEGLCFHVSNFSRMCLREEELGAKSR